MAPENTALFHAAAALLPEPDFSIVEFGDLPLVNRDFEQGAKLPVPAELPQTLRNIKAPSTVSG
jgi:hypothetical protein